jgi:hypothetical protein
MGYAACLCQFSAESDELMISSGANNVGSEDGKIKLRLQLFILGLQLAVN